MSVEPLAWDEKWWQWCWWHRYVGDFMMVTDFRCWWQNHYVGDFFRYVGDFLNLLNRSPTSCIGHQHLKLVTNTFGLQHPSPTSMLPPNYYGRVQILPHKVKSLIQNWTNPGAAAYCCWLYYHSCLIHHAIKCCIHQTDQKDRAYRGTLGEIPQPTLNNFIFPMNFSIKLPIHF